FRGLNDGLDLRESIARAVATSGGAVVFAGSTVTIALVSLAVANIPLVTTMLSITGPHINSLRVRGRHPGRRDPAHPHKGLWARWAEGVARHPVIAMVAALAILIPLAVPLLSLNLGQKDVAALSTSTTERRAYDLISQNFGPGVNGPLLVAVSLGSPAQAPASSSSSSSSGSSSPQGSDPRATDPRLQTLEKDVSATQGVAAVTPIQIDK